MDIPDVFIFCWYPNGWMPRAIIADISKLNDKAKGQMERILNIKDDVLERTSKGIKGSNNNIIVNDEETLIAVNTWQNLSDNVHTFTNMSKDDLNHWIHFAHEYYINDANSNLSPADLHNAISLMSYHPKSSDLKFNVKHCVLLSDVPISLFDNNPLGHIKQLRFFYKTKTPVTEAKLADTLRLTFNVKKVIIADGCYGYITPKDIKQWSDLNGKKFIVGDIIVMFD